MACHIARMLVNPYSNSITLVLGISKIEVGGRTFRSFASKFVHWFIDERCPILDSVAIKLLYSHLGAKPVNASLDIGWYEFCRDVEGVRRIAKLNCSERELDRYLWLAGQCLRIEDNERVKNGGKKPLAVNGELRRLWNEREAKGLTREFEVLLAGFHDPQRVR